VCNVLNSINVSVETLIATVNTSALQEIKKLSDLFDTHKKDLPHFLSKDPQGIYVGAYVNELAQCYQQENELTTHELSEITKNLELIKSIILTQQKVITVNNFEEIISIHDLLDEILLLSGVSQRKEIKVIKKYANINYIIIDKIKLFQILDNLISNAKDALLESSNSNKSLIITTRLHNKDTIELQVSENGIGIEQDNLNKIFIFGFTTKETGHGFGLHASALAVNELGGEIFALSEGKEKGATFVIKIPYRKASLIKAGGGT
jgi:signal transduction histidine kinase